MKVWVLTSEFNDYDQHGEYFEGVYQNKPTRKQIKDALQLNDSVWAEKTVDLMLNGGGREGNDHVWYYLREVECK